MIDYTARRSTVERFTRWRLALARALTPHGYLVVEASPRGSPFELKLRVDTSDWDAPIAVVKAQLAELRELAEVFQGADVHRLNLGPQDVIALTFPGRLSADVYARLRDHLLAAFGPRKVMILEGGSRIQAVGPDLPHTSAKEQG